MDKTTNEVMDILQEECAEVIQAVSKIRRVGIDNPSFGNQVYRRALVLANPL